MDALVVYDSSGKIYYISYGEVTEPLGIPFLHVTIPTGSILQSINTSVVPNVPVFEELPKSELTELKEQLAAVQIALAEMMGV